jgi:hypothetical protein
MPYPRGAVLGLATGIGCLGLCQTLVSVWLLSVEGRAFRPLIYWAAADCHIPG